MPNFVPFLENVFPGSPSLPHSAWRSAVHTATYGSSSLRDDNPSAAWILEKFKLSLSSSQVPLPFPPPLPSHVSQVYLELPSCFFPLGLASLCGFGFELNEARPQPYAIWLSPCFLCLKYFQICNLLSKFPWRRNKLPALLKWVKKQTGYRKLKGLSKKSSSSECVFTIK